MTTFTRCAFMGVAALLAGCGGSQSPIGPFIVDYNENRSHSSLGKRSPAEFERMYHQAAKGQPAQAELSVP